MTHKIEPIAKAMTAIAAILALSTTPLLAQDTTAPDPSTDTPVETPAPADPLAAEPAATESAPPPAPRPKVETARKAERAAPSASRPAARSTARQANAAKAATSVPPRTVEVAEPAPPPAQPEPLTAAAPAAPPPVATPAPASSTPVELSSNLVTNDMLPIAGAAALGLLALGGVGMVARRRRRRREDEEFAVRQQALAMIGDEPTLELGQADEVRPGPALRRAPEPIHDPVPGDSRRTASRPGATVQAKVPVLGNWESRQDADFLFRRADGRRPVEQD